MYIRIQFENLESEKTKETLVKYPGVSRVDILPIEGKYYDNYDDVIKNIMQYTSLPTSWRRFSD